MCLSNLTMMCLFVAFVCFDKVNKKITVLLEELNCKKSQSFEYSSLKKVLRVWKTWSRLTKMSLYFMFSLMKSLKITIFSLKKVFITAKSRNCHWRYYINPIQDGIFWGCSRMTGCLFAPLPKICDTYHTIIKLGTVIPYLRKTQKVYK